MGSISFINDSTQQRVSEWIAGVSCLSSFANTQPHASYSAFTHGYVSKWNYYFRTNSGISALLSPLESAVRNHLIPKLVPHAVSDIEWELFSFPVRFGGLGICNPVSNSEEQYGFSRALLQGFVDLVLSQKSALCSEVTHHQNDLFRHLSAPREQSLSAQLQSTISNCPPPLRWAVECCMERGASAWLSALPLEQYGFALHKGKFIDAVCLHYGFTLSMLPSHCVCQGRI